MESDPIESNNLIEIDQDENELMINDDNTNPIELDELDTEVIYILVPDGIEDSEEIGEWFNSSSVLSAKLFLCQKVLERNSTEIDTAFKFLKVVERGFLDTCCGDGPTSTRIKESVRRTKRILLNITRFLMLSDDGTYSGEAPQDLGSEGLNRLATMIVALERRMDRRFTQMNRRFTRIERRLIRMDRKLDSLRSVQANKFKVQGGMLGSETAYDEIANKDGKYPSEENMEPICSLRQIDGLNSAAVDKYLRFYGLPIRGSLIQRKKRLKYCIGVPHAQVIREEFGIY